MDWATHVPIALSCSQIRKSTNGPLLLSMNNQDKIILYRYNLSSGAYNSVVSNHFILIPGSGLNYHCIKSSCYSAWPMKSIINLLVVCFMIFSAVALQAASDTGLVDRPANVIFILVDDMGWSDLGIYGNQFHETPNIDSLAMAGMRFTNAYAAAPVCSPSRASIMTGQYPARVGITDFIPGTWRPYARVLTPRNRQQQLPLSATTVGEALRADGYATGYFGKWHLGKGGVEPWHQGFDQGEVYDGYKSHYDLSGSLITREKKPLDPGDDKRNATDYITEKSVEFVKNHKDKPFFLFISYFVPHLPLQSEPELIAKYERKPKPEGGASHPVYAAMMEHADLAVGEVLSILEQEDLQDNTIVIFFSDNGGLIKTIDKNYNAEVTVTSNLPLRGEKGTLYEGGIRVPLIVRWPGVVSPGSVSDDVVSSVDFFPTILEMTGDATPAAALDGRSFVASLRGNRVTERTLFWHYPHYHHAAPQSAVRQGDYKLIESLEDGSLELYNLPADVGESRNLAQREEGQLRELKQLLDSWRKSVAADMPKINPDFDKDRTGEYRRFSR